MPIVDGTRIDDLLRTIDAFEAEPATCARRAETAWDGDLVLRVVANDRIQGSGAGPGSAAQRRSLQKSGAVVA